MAPLPKLKTKSYDNADMPSSLLPPETVVGYELKYKRRPGSNHYRYYGYIDRSRFTFSYSDEAIKTELYANNLSKEEIEQFVKWLDKNAVAHRTSIRWNQPKIMHLSAGDKLKLDNLDITHGQVESVIHRRLTDQQRADIAQAEQNVLDRKAKAKVKAAETRKKEAEARRKVAAAIKAKEEREEAILTNGKLLREAGDLASALKIMKKHGLKVVVVKENGE